MKVEIKNRWDGEVMLCGEYESVKDCLEKNRGANLGDAYLRGADLVDANLGDAKNYLNSHDFWIEIIRREKIETFTEKEWSIIGQVSIHRLCWDSIKKRYGKKIMLIFKKLSKAGFDEWEKHYSKFLKEGE